MSIKRDIWFAWYPVHTQENGWVWLQKVMRRMDEHSFLKGIPEIAYYKLD